MLGNVRLRHWPRAHDLLDFVNCHFVLPEGHVVDEETSAELVGNESSDSGPPGDTENHIERDAQSLQAAELVVTTEMVDAGGADSHSIEGQTEGNVASVLLLLLGEEELVGLVLELGTLCHCTSSQCHC